jgi:hypothetical protein
VIAAVVLILVVNQSISFWNKWRASRADHATTPAGESST